MAIDYPTRTLFILDTEKRDIFIFSSGSKKFIFTASMMIDGNYTPHQDKIRLSGLFKKDFWPRDMQIVNSRVYVIDTCVCTYDPFRNKLIEITEGGNCIRIFSSNNLKQIKVIKHRNMIRPLGLIVDCKGNIFTTGNFIDNHKKIHSAQYLFCFNYSGKILRVISLEVDLKDRGIFDLVFVNKYKLLLTSPSLGFIVCNFKII
jgi:hypothetical protein